MIEAKKQSRPQAKWLDVHIKIMINAALNVHNRQHMKTRLFEITQEHDDEMMYLRFGVYNKLWTAPAT